MFRKHRIQEDELPYVMKAVFLRLAQLEDDEVTDETEALFRVLWRFNRYRSGPSAYPEEITRDEVTGLLNSLYARACPPTPGQHDDATRLLQSRARPRILESVLPRRDVYA